MARKKLILTQKESTGDKIKVRLDHKTLIIINKLSSFDTWKKLYPEARIV
ncbi:MAG: hypothetical protein IPG90_16570 [Bacteroidetes bacterium]|nr:hypothetical protein [Bacteroidota bacterium]MBK6839678.1 hypothetical protein [Bacteroidota bacterium]MBK9526160.1 hypothetical protein [Bacteroidota bacterium]MBK9543723.1 hypothetical protein [Bacteroidota bacterium]MBL0258027.1 hypothetical protein [Bacteroidota bacterium]